MTNSSGTDCLRLCLIGIPRSPCSGRCLIWLVESLLWACNLYMIYVLGMYGDPNWAPWLGLHDCKSAVARGFSGHLSDVIPACKAGQTVRLGPERQN